MWDKIVKALSALAGAIISFFTGMPPLIWILLAVMSLDYITGILCGFMGKSPKTETGGLSSRAAFTGLLKKILVLIVVMVAALADRAIQLGAGVQFAAVTGATCLWFIAAEALSILENAASMGVKIPAILMKALEILREKGAAPAAAEAPTPSLTEAHAAAEAREPEKPPADD
jgi:toxin secretion/phage lysis holin